MGREKRFGLIKLTDLEGAPVFVEAGDVVVIGPRRTQFNSNAPNGALVVLNGGISVFVQEDVFDVVRATTIFYDPETGEVANDPDLVPTAATAIVDVDPSSLVVTE